MNCSIQAMFAVVDAAQWDELPQFYHVQVVYERPGFSVIEGIDRLLKFYREERIIGSGRHFIEGFVSNDHDAACWGRFVGLGKDGRQLDERFADVYGFFDGKIRTRRTHFYRAAV